MKNTSILGCGWLGLPLAIELIKRGHDVKGSTTTAEKKEVLEKAGIKPYIFDLTNPLNIRDFFKCDMLVVCIPPRLKAQGEMNYINQLSKAAKFAILEGVKHVIFTSTTSIYPDLNREVNESDADPLSIFAKAENIFKNNDNFVSTIVRFAGLVGPGRHPGKFLSGKVTGGGDLPVNVIHLNDCVSILSRILDEETNHTVVYNACADKHPSRKEYYTQASFQAGLPPPLFEDSSRASFKIVSNEFLKKQLGFTYRFPDPMKMVY